MATLSSSLAWRIPWTVEPDGLQSTGLQRVRHDCVTHFHFQKLWCSMLHVVKNHHHFHMIIQRTDSYIFANFEYDFSQNIFTILLSFL